MPVPVITLNQPQMRKSLLVIGLLAGIVYACNQQDKTASHLLSTNKLPTQVVSIDITKDTVLHTKNGALIRIPHGALSSSSNPVQLEIKEAYTMQDILKGGLTTMSNGQPLSSGGMMYINPVGDNKVEIKQPISIATPTPFLDSNMKVFKGEVQPDSTINWVDPKPLGENPQLAALDSGRILFQQCASCHALGHDLTGPDLAHILKRSFPALYEDTKAGRDHFYEFTRNPAKALFNGPNQGYYRCLKNKFGGVVMTAWNNITNRELELLYDYIENESERRHLPVPDNGILKCRDSCALYLKAAAHWKEVKATLEKEAVEMVIEKTAPTADTTGPLVKVSPISNTSLYYQFTVNAFGWYNVDKFLKTDPDVKPSNLRVLIQGQYKTNFNLYLIIPSAKVFQSGAPLDDENEMYAFYVEDGAIPLPQNTKAYIIAMGEHEDQIIFTKTEFITKEKQDFTLKLTTITKEAFQQQIASLQLGDLTITANDTKNAAELRAAVKELKNAEQLKPKNCNCDCFLDIPTDTTVDAVSDIYLSKPVVGNEY